MVMTQEQPLDLDGDAERVADWLENLPTRTYRRLVRILIKRQSAE